MCKEFRIRYRRCGHARNRDWAYCSHIPPNARLCTATGRACPRYKVRYVKPSPYNPCPDCSIQERIREYIEEEQAKAAAKAARREARRAARTNANNNAVVSALETMNLGPDTAMGSPKLATPAATAKSSTTNLCTSTAGVALEGKLHRCKSGISSENTLVEKGGEEVKTNERQKPKGLKGWIKEFLFADQEDGGVGVRFQTMGA